jgi:hypothetical protein
MKTSMKLIWSIILSLVCAGCAKDGYVVKLTAPIVPSIAIMDVESTLKKHEYEKFREAVREKNDRWLIYYYVRGNTSRIDVIEATIGYNAEEKTAANVRDFMVEVKSEYVGARPPFKNKIDETVEELIKVLQRNHIEPVVDREFVRPPIKFM